MGSLYWWTVLQVFLQTVCFLEIIQPDISAEDRCFPLSWINIWSSFRVVKMTDVDSFNWQFQIVKRHFFGRAAATLHRERSEERVNMSCRAERRGGPVADMWRVNKLVGPRRVGRSWTFPHSADVSGQQNVYVSLLPCWGDFVTFISWKKKVPSFQFPHYFYLIKHTICTSPLCVTGKSNSEWRFEMSCLWFLCM